MTSVPRDGTAPGRGGPSFNTAIVATVIGNTTSPESESARALGRLEGELSARGWSVCVVGNSLGCHVSVIESAAPAARRVAAALVAAERLDLISVWRDGPPPPRGAAEAP